MIELLVSATIIAVLSAIGLVSFRSANMKARNGKRMADLQQVRAALEIYRSDFPTYPNDTVTGDMANISDVAPNPPGGNLSDYLSSDSIIDPKTGTYDYSYDSDGITYTLCANMEPEGTPDECVVNP